MFFTVGGREWGTTPEEEPQLLLPDTGTASHCWQVQGTTRYRDSFTLLAGTGYYQIQGQPHIAGRYRTLPDKGTALHCWQVQEIQRQHYIADSSVADP